jgi:hypothetical protein
LHLFTHRKMQKDYPMPDLAEAVAMAVIESAAAELSDLIETVKACRSLEDKALDDLAWRGDALLDHIAGYRAPSLEGVLLKLHLWRRLPADLWDGGPIIASVVADLRAFAQ